MVSDTELAEYLGQVLRTADLTTTTNAILRKQLEEHFGVDLSGKKAFIREQVDLYLQNLENDAGEDEEAGKQSGAVDAQNGNDSEEGGDAEEGDEGEVEEEEEADDDDEDNSGAGGSNGKSRKKKGSNKSDKDVKRKGGGFTKLCSLSPQLQKFVGEPELARTEVVKRIWAYIRKHDLQDPSNRRKIICDANLNGIFNVKSIDMFQMNKALSKHIWPLDSSDVSTTAKEKEKEKEKQGKRPKKRAEEEEEEEDDEEDEPSKKEKRRKTGTTGFLAPLPISDALSKFVGTGVTEMSRADVVKTMWDYIKQNKLQDPSDKRRIICDGKLKELFEVDSFHGFTVAKLLGPHFIKSEK